MYRAWSRQCQHLVWVAMHQPLLTYELINSCWIIEEVFDQVLRDHSDLRDVVQAQVSVLCQSVKWFKWFMLKDGKCNITYYTITDLANNQMTRGQSSSPGILNGGLWKCILYFFWLSKPGNRPADRCCCWYIWKQSTTVWHAAFVASTVYLSVVDRQQLVHTGLLLRYMLESIHALFQSYL